VPDEVSDEVSDAGEAAALGAVEVPPEDPEADGGVAVGLAVVEAVREGVVAAGVGEDVLAAPSPSPGPHAVSDSAAAITAVADAARRMVLRWCMRSPDFRCAWFDRLRAGARRGRQCRETPGFRCGSSVTVVGLL
jgi:hypothetical protein